MKKIYKIQAVLLAACVFTGLAGCGREKSNIMTIPMFHMMPQGNSMKAIMRFSKAIMKKDMVSR